MTFTSAASAARPSAKRIVAPVVATTGSELILMAFLLLQIEIDLVLKICP
jgi:hypothetical protein